MLASARFAFVCIFLTAASLGSCKRLVLNTWPFTTATEAAWSSLVDRGSNALDAVQAGCTECEVHPCAPSVGFGGSPDEQGNTTLDALIMDGVTHRAGAVASMRRIKNAIGVARAVMDHTKHTMLVGESATQFAIQMGFKEEELNTNESLAEWRTWATVDNCQPNFRQHVTPDPSKSCGPYKPSGTSQQECRDQNCELNLHDNALRYKPEDIRGESDNIQVGRGRRERERYSHDTIGMIVLDDAGNLAVGTSTNGATWKVPGRVGDSSLVGIGAYVDNEVGAAVGTGDGDTLMRFSPTFLVVELMSAGHDPEEACTLALRRIAKYEPNVSGALLAYSRQLDRFGAACIGFEVEWHKQFPFAVRDDSMSDVQVKNVTCFA